MIVGRDDADRAPLSVGCCMTGLTGPPPRAKVAASAAPRGVTCRRRGHVAAQHPGAGDAAAKAPRRSTRSTPPLGRRSPSSKTPAAMGRRFVAAVMGPSEAIAPPCWNARWRTTKPRPCAPAVAYSNGEESSAPAVVVGEGDQQRLAGDVAHAVAEARGEAAERGRAPAQRAGDDHERGGRERAQPGGRGCAARRRARTAGADGQRHQAERGEQGTGPLAAYRERPLGDRGEDDQQADAARRNGLHEREGRQGERREVEAPTGQAEDESGQPAPAREQRCGRRAQPAQRELRGARHGALLDQEAGIQRERGREREAEPAGECRRHARRPRQGAEGSVR